ncbi:hypothetical protein GCM10023189_40180 [Nibrella saemangeumensis]|uniref:Serine protease n=1 Tax=Nibrella saemangeumensis TaxID=1084526 RepID=A0ABP8NB23_9BACT
MSNKKEISSFTPEELLSELRQRESKTLAKSKSNLSGFPAKEIFENLLESQKVIYGVDDRKEIFEIVESNILNNADSIVAIFNFDQIVSNGDGTSKLSTRSYKEAHRLCSEEPFLDQPVGPHCTGFLVAPDIIATAGHCINGTNFLMKRFVFGFQMINSSLPTLTISDKNIFKAIGIIDRRLEQTGSDYALIRLDRPVTGRKVLKLNQKEKIADNEDLYVIGHPSGLPKKFADGAKVRDNSASTHFVANLDTYAGNSGSPVFNANTHEVEGILVRGENDFVLVNGCARSLVCPSTGCRGEDVTRVSEFLDKVPKIIDPVNSLEERVANLEVSIQSFKSDFDELKALLKK